MLRLGLFALVQELAYLFLLFFSPYLDAHFQWLPLYLGVWGGIFVIYFFALYRRGEAPQEETLGLILFSGLVFRVTALFIQNLVLSHDLYLYIWYGRLQSEGFNPYLYTAMDPALEHLRDPNIWHHIAFKHILPIYPPLLMKIFHLAYVIGGDSLVAFKILWLLPELGIFGLGVALLRHFQKSPVWILVYAWCPLPILEYLGMGHSDTWGICFLLLALWLFEKRRWAGAGAALAGSILIKIFPVILLPIFFFRMGWRERVKFGAAFLVTMVAAYIPFLSAGVKVVDFLLTFVQSFQFNGSIYQLLFLLTGHADRAHLITNLLIFGLALFVAIRKIPLLQASFYAMLGFLLLSYQIFPWYMGYFLPFLLLISCWGVEVWLLTCLFSYYVLLPYRMGKGWHELPWILLAEYLPVYGLLFIQWWRNRTLTPTLSLEGRGREGKGFKTSRNIYSPNR